MLILSRTPGESIYINDNIRVTVVAIEGRQIKLGIDAPREIPVHREEVHKLIKDGKGKFDQPNGDSDANG